VLTTDFIFHVISIHVHVMIVVEYGNEKKVLFFYAEE